MRAFIVCVIVCALALSAVQLGLSRSVLGPASQANLNGRWRVKFNISGIGEKSLILDVQIKSDGSLTLLDAGPENQPMAAVPMVWSTTTNDRISFSSEVELPIGTCCRETGTLILKGKFQSADALAGKAIFVGSTIDEENAVGLRTLTGNFTAARVPQK